MNSGNLQIIRRLAHSVSGSASYTLMKSMDDTPSLGGGGSTVAQDPQNLGAEWALSNFDRRDQFTGNLLWELPFGVNRRWLTNGGFFSSVFGGWSMSLLFTDAVGNAADGDGSSARPERGARDDRLAARQLHRRADSTEQPVDR